MNKIRTSFFYLYNLFPEDQVFLHKKNTTFILYIFPYLTVNFHKRKRRMRERGKRSERECVSPLLSLFLSLLKTLIMLKKTKN